MKRFIAITIFSIVFYNAATAQMKREIPPESTGYSRALFENLPDITLPVFTAEEIATLDYNDSKNGKPPKFARNILINVKLNNSGIWINLPDGSRIWRVRVTSKGALGLLPIFDTLYLPQGALLHVYMPGKEEVLGAYTHDNTPEPRPFCSGLVHGETCIIEYYEPQSQRGKGIVSMDKIGHAYRWVSPGLRSVEGTAGSCEVNPACSEGADWQDQVRSSVRIYIIDRIGAAFCSGSLINNVRNDCTPYILSAEHCTEDGVTAGEFAEWVFLFNFTASTCSGDTSYSTDIVNGCTKIADSQDNGGNRGSDFLLLRLNSVPPSGYNVYYSGWSNTPAPPDSGVCIHHPEGDITKISTYHAPVTSTSWGDTASDTHWLLSWEKTANGYGITEPGSSGSGLYNQQKLIVGHLTGGNSCCTLNACGPGTSPTGTDYFGKIAFDWLLNGVTTGVQLQPWLDPDNTGATEVAGMNPPCGGSLRNDAGIQAVVVPNGDVCSQTIMPSIALRNFGSNQLTSVVLNYIVDNGTLVQFHWTGSLIPGGTANVTLPGITLATGNHLFEVSTSSPNDTTDSNPSNDYMSVNFYVAPPAAALVLDLTTDDAGSQIYWQLTDAGSNLVASGGPYANFLGGEQFQIPICVEPGCYTYTIYAFDGNGITTGEDGNFQITGPGGSPVYASLSNPNFGNQEAHNFCVTVSGIVEPATSYLSVTPNPSTGVFNILFDNYGEKSLRVYDVLGRIVLDKNFYDQRTSIDLSAFGKGVYILETETADGKHTQKLVVD